MGGFEVMPIQKPSPPTGCLCGTCLTLHLPQSPLPYTLPHWLPPTGWQIVGGYLKYTSRAIRHNIPRGAWAHRLVGERVWGDRLPDGWVVHHQHSRRNNCPLALILMPEQLNIVLPPRCPYTGKFLGRAGGAGRGAEKGVRNFF